MTDAIASSSRRFRTDIQALRGFAVLIVLLYHAKISLFSAGYLGVDVFFVISGFLITTLIKKGIETDSFRFSDFYFRRAKRLLPAAYVTFLATALLAPFFLASSEMEDFRAQMAGAVTFTANIVLLQQSGYFGGDAELKPFLHVWSLAIEEQYYFVLPASMVFTPRRLWLRVAILVLVSSLALCLLRAGKESTFYLLPTRAWELTIGSVGALILPSAPLARALKAAFWPAFILMLTLPLTQFGTYHPGIQALLICMATIVVILRQHPLLFDGATIQVLSKVGDMSYSLYLVHWPLFAFFNNAWLGEVENQQSAAMRIGLIALSLLLAYLLNRYIEEPIRRAEIKQRLRALGSTLATSLGLIVITTGIAHAVSPSKDYAYVRRVNYGLDRSCEFKGDFSPIPECLSSGTPEVMVWGDSFAMHLVPGLLEVEGGPPPIVQATRSGCGPLLGIAAIRLERGYDKKRAESCIQFNDSVIAYLRATDSIEVVVLSSPFSQYLNEDWGLLIRNNLDGGYGFADSGIDKAVHGLKQAVDTVRAMGKRAIVIAPPPRGTVNPSRCLERLERGLPILGDAGQCRIRMDSYRKGSGRVLEFLAEVPRRAGVEVISFDSYLCEPGLCRTYIDGTFIYRDTGHFSYEGSVFVAKAVSLVQQIYRAAK